MTAERGNESGAGLAALLEELQPEILRFLAARCGSAEDAQDMLQDLWLKLADLQPGPVANGRAYLYRIANNLAVDRARARQRSMARDRRWIDRDGDPAGELLDRPDPAQPADEALADRQEAEILAQAIEALPPGAQRALRLYRFEGRKQDEIAEIMGISRSGVEKHLAVAMRHLRSALLDCGLFGAATSQEQEQTRRGGTRQETRT